MTSFRMYNILLVLGLALLGSVQLSAQRSFTVSSENVSTFSELTIDNCVYLDRDEGKCYIDLEKVPMLLKEAVLLNVNGQEVFKESLVDVPVNDIVEIPYAEFPKGAYILELRSYRSKLYKSLEF